MNVPYYYWNLNASLNYENLNYENYSNVKMNYEKMGNVYGFKKAIPPPYYRVRLQDVQIRKRLDHSLRTTRELSYRHDRRGHECWRFRRGGS